MRLFFKKQQRIVRERDFKAVLSRRCFVTCGTMRLYAAPNGLEWPRFAVSVGRKYGSAVQRNRIKRLARQAFRIHQHDLPSGRDYLLILTAAKPIKEKGNRLRPDYQTFELQFLQMVQSLSQKPCFQFKSLEAC